MYLSAIGQDSHRFVSDEFDFSSQNEAMRGKTKKLMLAGCCIENETALDGNSDADVVLHALCNAISGISGVNVLGKITDKMCLEENITDSRLYVKYALQTLDEKDKIIHVSFSIECSKPKLAEHIEAMKKSVANMLGLSEKNIGITATTGEGLTEFGRGLGIQCFCAISVFRESRL